jgi:hypothetical protein
MPGGPGGPGDSDDYVPAGIPWERREEIGTWNALVQTVRLSLLEPTQFFRDLPPEGPTPPPTFGAIGAALFYAILIAIPSAIVSLFWQMGASWFSIMMGEGDEALLGIGQGLAAAVATPILVPIVIIISAAIIHLILMVLGGANRNLVATFRVVCYASAPDLLAVVPLCGALIGAIWGIVLLILGLTIVHRTTWVKATLAVVLPFVVCCGCVVLILMAAILGAD